MQMFCPRNCALINTMVNRAIENRAHVITRAHVRSPLACVAGIAVMPLPACIHTHPPRPRHFIDRNALWDTCRKFGRVILPRESQRILLNYRAK
jgi:hypothetical protein